MLLSWKDTDEVPWGVLILIGGGMALSKQISASGLSSWIGGQMGGLDVFPTVILLTVVAAVLIVLSELASNTAVAAAFLPVMGAVAVSAAIDPVLMAMTVAMAVTCSFMLPVATPSNSVAYATGELELRHMVRAGIWLNVAGLALTIGMLYTFIPLHSVWRHKARPGRALNGATRQVSERYPTDIGSLSASLSMMGPAA